MFFGDSITDIWKLEDYFPGKPYLNRGIGGQTTPQMLVRFRQDVIDLHPKVVVILAGTNDIAGNTGPMSLQDIEANYSSLAELARAHNIRVVFSSVLPVHNYTPKSQDFFAQRSPEKILALNRLAERLLRRQCSGLSRLLQPDGGRARACSNAIWPKTDCIPTRPATRSWPRWRKRRSLRRWPSIPKFTRSGLPASIMRLSFRPPQPVGSPWPWWQGVVFFASPARARSHGKADSEGAGGNACASRLRKEPLERSGRGISALSVSFLKSTQQSTFQPRWASAGS